MCWGAGSAEAVVIAGAIGAASTGTPPFRDRLTGCVFFPPRPPTEVNGLGGIKFSADEPAQGSYDEAARYSLGAGSVNPV